MRKIKYKESDILLLPLENGGFARGVIARMDGRGIVFGYFFGPTIHNPDQFPMELDLVPDKAILVCQFGDYGLVNEVWKVVGHINEWSREVWVLPKFIRWNRIDPIGFITEYDDCLNEVGETMIRDKSEAPNGLPKDTLMGSEVVEHRLTLLLC